MELFYRKYGNSPQNIIILHGFMGLSDHWIPIAKKLANDYTVYVPDQRNHGKSFWNDDFNYPALAQDLADFIKRHKIDNPTLIGHSMGGKVVMQFLLQFPGMKVKNSIVIDILPLGYPPNPEFKRMIDLANSTNLSQFKDRKEIIDFLEKQHIYPRFRRLVIKNIIRKEGEFRWKINIGGLHHTFNSIFDGLLPQTSQELEIAFIRGGKSPLVSEEGMEQTRKIFPNARFLTIEDVGHWIHVDKPETLTRMIRELIPLAE